MHVLTVVLGLTASLTLGLPPARPRRPCRHRRRADNGFRPEHRAPQGNRAPRRRLGSRRQEGTDESGNEIEMEVDARKGRIIKMKRGRGRAQPLGLQLIRDALPGGYKSINLFFAGRRAYI